MLIAWGKGCERQRASRNPRKSVSTPIRCLAIGGFAANRQVADGCCWFANLGLHRHSLKLDPKLSHAAAP